MPQFKVSEAATLLGVSDDTVRRWLDAGRLSPVDSHGAVRIDGAELAALAQEVAKAPMAASGAASARNRFTGLVTAVTADTVMAQVELQCGPFRVVSLISAEAVRELGLEPGSVAVASIKATNVVLEVPQ
ncbi:TOBE domain-containing protein [Propionibacteriaceae bacterium Y2011]|uniref:TOBE domain-containing protein n=1 Tax=Microlunatus sp. Y2014 TaxID=3418488 RepID=UPI003B4C9243